MLPTLIKIENQQPTMQQQPQQKITKVRRTRQPRNPQLSVARRNERERNRVKMVNNGFALLREHLPVEDLQACEQSGSDTPTPDGGSVAGQKQGKAKKFSKVETLRAAIQRIKMLEELIRSTEPGFESINISSTNSQLAAYDEEEPLSVFEPLSCGSQSSHSNSNSTSLHISNNHIQESNNHSGSTLSTTFGHPREHFIKLEPQNCNQLPIANVPSPQNSQTSHNSGLNNQTYNQTTQVHHHLNNQHMSQQQHEPSHTHLWIQQHQNSFMEQQQQYQQQQMNWYPAQQQQAHMEANQHKNNWFIHQTESPEQVQILTSQQQQQQLPHDQQSQQQQAQQYHNQVDSPIWFNGGSPSAAITSASQPSMPFNHLQQHQISLYSQ